MNDDTSVGYNILTLALFLNGLVYLILAISRPEFFLSMESGAFLLSIIMATSVGSIVGALGLLRDEKWGWYVAFYTTLVIVSFEAVVPLFIAKGFEVFKITVGILVLGYMLQNSDMV